MNLDITLILPTFNRPEIVKEAVYRFDQNVRYDLGDIHFLVGNDGDDFSFSYRNLRVIPGPKKGLGANLNRLITTAKTSLIFQMDDDHFLMQPLDLNDHAINLVTEPAFGWIRFYLGECIRPEEHYHFSAEAWGDYWRLLPYDELYLPSNRPHLKAKEFHSEGYGWYKEGLKLGETETEFCHRFIDEKRKHGDGLPDVFIPMYGLNKYMWAHVGESLQDRGY